MNTCILKVCPAVRLLVFMSVTSVCIFQPGEASYFISYLTIPPEN